MERLLNLFYAYRFSITLTILLFLYFFYNFGLSIFSLLLQNLISVNWKIFVLASFAGYIGSLSFVLPFYALSKKNGIAFFKLCLETLRWMYKSILNENYEKIFLRRIKVKDKMFFEKVKFSDITAILIIILITYPLLNFNVTFFSFVLFFELIYIVYHILPNFSFLKNYFLVILASVSRYFLEMLTPLIIFSSVGILLDLPSLLFFTASTSLLYYLPKFKLAGGLLELYLTLMFHFLSEPITGLVIAILFRLASILFFLLPLSIISRLI